MRDFVNQSSVWERATPTLEHVVRWVNTHQQSLGTAVSSMADARRNSLLAELAFVAVSKGYEPFVQTLSGRDAETVRTFISALPGGWPAIDDVTTREWYEIDRLARVLARYTSQLDSPTFHPAIPGCGVVDSATADIVTPAGLIEVKAVTRPFRSNDVRQSLVYTAMLYAVGELKQTIALVNPRRARYVLLPINFVAEAAGGGSAVELTQDLVEAMTGLQISA